jgi:hypothetical protein
MIPRAGHEYIGHRRFYVRAAKVPAHEADGNIPPRRLGEDSRNPNVWLASLEPMQNVVT